MLKLSFNQPDSVKVRGVFRASQIAAFLFALVFLACTAPTLAQTSQGFTGVVADQTGAVIPKAKVTVRNQATGVDKTVISTGAGAYSVPFLDPGVYTVTVAAAGFKQENKTDITLLTDQVVTVNFSLPPGSVTETVTINASADILDYSKPDRGDVIENARIEGLPVLAGDPFNLALLSAGAMSTLAASSYNPYNQTAQSLSIHGAAVELNIDGLTDLSMTGAQNYSYDPPKDSVQEFKIATDAFDSASGRSPGGSIDMTLKTGTSRLHGDAYETMRRGFLDANSAQNNGALKLPSNAGLYLPQFQRPAHTKDQYGIEVDGPVIIPKLLHGNQKTFFLFQYEHIYDLTGTASSGSVPTQAMIGNGTAYPGAGDFSAFLTANGASYNQPIYDPLTEASCTANNTDNGTYAGKNPHVCRYQFGYGPGGTPGPQGNPAPTGAPINVIPANRMNPIAVATLSWFAYPNQAPTPTTANDFANNYGVNNPTTNSYRNFLLKLDNSRGNNDSFNLTMAFWTNYGTSINGDVRNNVNPAHPGLNWGGYGAHFNNHFRDPSVIVGWTHTFSPNLINSFKIKATVTNQTDNTGPPNGFNPTALGYPASWAATNPLYYDRFPSTSIGNYNIIGSIPGLIRGDNELALIDIANYVHRNHTIHFGLDYRPAQYSQGISNGAGNGMNLNVAKGWTQQWDTVVTGGATSISSPAGYSGNSVASFELGTLDSGNATAQPPNYYSFHYLAAFVQDDWKVRPNLTLNLGLRWENPSPGTQDRQNRQIYTFDTTDINPISSMISPGSLPYPTNLLGGITFAGVNGNPRTPFAPIRDDFGPRAGFAYSLNNRTVFRGGIGVNYADNGTNIAPPQTGFATTTTYTGTLDGGATPLQNLSNPFPTFQTPTGNCGGNQIQCLETNAGQSLSFINPNYRPAIYLESSVGVERQLTKWDTIEVAYAGSRGYNGSYSDDLNHISAAAQAACDPERGGTGTNCSAGSSTGTGGYITNPFKGLAPFAASGTYYTASTIPRINFSRPYPIFTSVTESNLMGTHAWYNAGEVTYNHRTSVGLDIHGTYSYSKSMTAGGYVDTVNRVQARNLSGSDNPHRITISGIYQLPVGRGRVFFSGMNRFLDAAVGGWNVSEVFIYQSGLPFGISGYEINPTANGGYILPRKRFFGGNTNPYWPKDQGATSNSYVQAFKPCVGTRDPNANNPSVVTLEAYSVAAGCGAANFVQLLGNSVTPNVEYTGIRLQRVVNMDAGIAKDITLVERLGIKFQIRLDAFNALNHVIINSSGYDTAVGDSNIGTIQMGSVGGANNLARQVQLAGKLMW